MKTTPILAVFLSLQAFIPLPSALAKECESLVVSVPEQRMYVFDVDGYKLASYKVSTSMFGLGDMPQTYCTPLGQLAIAEKFGGGARPGTVFKHCQPTGEIVPPNSPGRDPIVTRIMSLRGLEAQNARASSRGVFIHGTPEERNIGRPASYGCIRMTSKDVMLLFEQARIGNHVEITTKRVGRSFDRLGRILEPVGNLFPSLGKIFNRTGNIGGRIVNPVDKVIFPVGKILDGVDRGVFANVDKVALRVTRPDPKRSTTLKTSEEARDSHRKR